MKKKKRIVRTIISTMLLCCMLVGDLGSVFATSVGSSVVSEQSSEEQGSSQKIQPLVEPIEEPNLGMHDEQSSEMLEAPVVEKPVETPEAETEVTPESTPEVEPEHQEVKPEVEPEPEKPVEKPEVKPELEVKQEEKPVENPSNSVPSKQPEGGVPSEEPVEPSVDSTTPSETDNWSLGLVFYDSTVDGGKTPLKSIDWDASDGGYGEGESRTITVQINYKNTNAVRAYQPGEVNINIPNMMYGCDSNLDWDVNCSANDNQHSGYDWNISNTNIIRYEKNIKFSNNIVFEAGSNFEGSIVLNYSINFKGLKDNSLKFPKDFTIVEHKGGLFALLDVVNNTVNSNSINYLFTRRYEYPWSYKSVAHSHKSVESVYSYDGLEGVDNYYWITLCINIEGGSYSHKYPYAYILPKNSYFLLDLPATCVVYNKNMNKCEYTGNNFKVAVSDVCDYSTYIDCKLIVGFPKSEYSGNTSVSITTDLYGAYIEDGEYKFFDEDTSNIDLLDYVFEPSNLYKFTKETRYSWEKLRYQAIKNNYYDGNEAEFDLKPSVKYVGEPYTLKYGDDILFCKTNSVNEENAKLLDSEYSISKITFDNLYNGQNNEIPKGTYDCELWVRYENESSYVLYDSFKNGTKVSYGVDFWNFRSSEKNVVGYYIIIKDLNESISKIHNSQAKIKFFKKDIDETGAFYNYGYQQIFFKDSEGNLVLQNPVSQDDYNSYFCRDSILQNDLDTYGTYIQRDHSTAWWEYYKVNNNSFIGTGSSVSKTTQDIKNEIFTGSLKGVLGFTPIADPYFNADYIKGIEDQYWYTGGVFYDLLPCGFELSSSKKDILNSLDTGFVDSGNNIKNGLGGIVLWDKLGTEISHSNFKEMVKSNTTVDIINNYCNTGRTLVKITLNLSSNPFIITINAATGTYYSKYCYGLVVDYNYKLSYDQFLSLGNSYMSKCFVEPIDRNCNVYPKSPTETDNFDFNNNGNVEEKLSYCSSNINVSSIVSTHQDVQTSVQTDKSNYSTGLVKASPESEYSYKLRARSGSNQVSNLVLVNNLEEGYEDNEHWKGEFLGIDTSFAENRTYRVYKPSDSRADAEGYVQEKVKVKPYCSTSTTEGELYQTEEKVITDPSGQQITQKVRVVDEHGNFVKNPNWLEYSDSVDRGTVKSLAFEFLDAETGEQAILPENNLIYVEVKMKAPVEADGLTADGKAKYAYNNCFTQWNALDSMGQAVDFITGINSNTVKVTVNDRVSVQINKVWEDEENKYNTRPNTVEFIMKKDGAEVDRQTLEKGKSTVTFSGLLVDELSTYTFEEVCPSGYTTEGVIYDKVTDTYTATNTLDPSSLVEVKGNKTWVGDLESERPESITVNLYRNDKKIDSKVVRASDGWSYDFGKFIKNDLDGNVYVYRVEEEPVEGYIASYAPAENGLNITFNSQCKTESASYDYVEIYYKGSDDKVYKLGKLGGTSLAGKVVGVPSKDFWLYWRTDSSSSNYYGFSIDSIESASVEATGTVATLPNYAVEEVSGSTYPNSAFGDHTHGNYGDSVNKVWHYTTGVSGFNITNTSNMIDISGTKYWEDAETIHPVSTDSTTESTRPASITVNLLQDGKRFKSTTTDESKGWEYSFRVPKLDENGREYKYSVREEPIEGYITSYDDDTNGSRITFSSNSRMESETYDYVEIYYEYMGKIYKAGKWGGTSIAGAVVEIPSKDFSIYWRTDSSGCNFYGFSIDSVENVDVAKVVGSLSNIPSYTNSYTTSHVEDLASEHNPYSNNLKTLIRYYGNSDKLGKYDILNTFNQIEISGTKHWEGDTPEMRPESITVNLLQNDTKIDSTTTDASKGWKYSFTVPKFNDTGKEYVYSVEEEPVEGYIPLYSGSGSRIHFSDFSRTESYNYDFVKIYYMYKGNLYSTPNLGGSSISGMTVDIPATEFYVYWNTDNSNENYYGYKIDFVEGIMLSEPLKDNSQESNLPCKFKEADSISDLQSNHNPYGNNVEELWKYGMSSGLYDITNSIDNIELRFTKVFNSGTYDSMMGLQHDGISFTLYENTLESGYPEAYPGTSDEWRKVGELSKYEVGGDIDNFRSEYYIDGLKSNKEYFLVENTDNLSVTYYANLDGGLTDSFNVSTAFIKDSCYVVETGLGTVDNIFLTVYGYSNTGEYKPSDKHDYSIDFCEYYGGYEEGTNLHSFLDFISSKYPVIPSDELVYSLQPMKFEGLGSWVIPNILETKRIGVTKKIKASDINFDNGNPTFIFEARVVDALGFSSKSSESELFNFPVLDIKHVEFTKEYVEANTDAEGYVSKTVYFDRIVPLSDMAVAERVGSRYDCSSVTVDGLGVSAIMSGMGCAEVFNTPFIETNITFTNEKYENQYYSHNSIVVNEIKRNKTSMVELK